MNRRISSVQCLAVNTERNGGIPVADQKKMTMIFQRETNTVQPSFVGIQTEMEVKKVTAVENNVYIVDDGKKAFFYENCVEEDGICTQLVGFDYLPQAGKIIRAYRFGYCNSSPVSVHTTLDVSGVEEFYFGYKVTTKNGEIYYGVIL